MMLITINQYVIINQAETIVNLKNDAVVTGLELKDNCRNSVSYNCNLHGHDEEVTHQSFTYICSNCQTKK